MKEEPNCHYCAVHKCQLIIAGKTCCPNCKVPFVQPEQKGREESFEEFYRSFFNIEGNNGKDVLYTKKRGIKDFISFIKSVEQETRKEDRELIVREILLLIKQIDLNNDMKPEDVRWLIYRTIERKTTSIENH